MSQKRKFSESILVKPTNISSLLVESLWANTQKSGILEDCGQGNQNMQMDIEDTTDLLKEGKASEYNGSVLPCKPPPSPSPLTAAMTNSYLYWKFTLYLSNSTVGNPTVGHQADVPIIILHFTVSGTMCWYADSSFLAQHPFSKDVCKTSNYYCWHCRHEVTYPAPETVRKNTSESPFNLWGLTLCRN